MGVLHRADFWTTPEAEITNEQIGQLLQGPLDGVIPFNHPESYAGLLELFCLTRGPLTIYINHMGSMMCERCHSVQDPRNIQNYVEGVHHILVHREIFQVYTRCDFCGEIVVRIREAWQCTECVEEYFETDREALAEGIPINVITRW